MERISSVAAASLLLCCMTLLTGVRVARAAHTNDVIMTRSQAGAAVAPSLPAECYHPAGKTCEWYSECLEKVFPCKARGQQDYALDFAQHYCEQFGIYEHDMSPLGRVWVESVRLCLQVALVPLLNMTDATNVFCTNLTKLAFASHDQCYLSPDASNRSIDVCALPCSDLALLVYIVWFRGHALTEEFGLTVEMMLKVGDGCLETKLSCVHWNHSSTVGVEPLAVAVTLKQPLPPHLQSTRTRADVARAIVRKLDDVFALRSRHLVALPNLDLTTSSPSQELSQNPIVFGINWLDMMQLQRQFEHVQDSTLEERRGYVRALVADVRERLCQGVTLELYVQHVGLLPVNLACASHDMY